jgi:hypothetical protein
MYECTALSIDGWYVNLAHAYARMYIYVYIIEPIKKIYIYTNVRIRTYYIAS